MEQRVARRGAPTRNVERAKDGADMGINGPPTQEQRISDLPIRQASSDKAEHFQLARGEEA